MSEVSGQKPVLAFAHANGIPGHSYDTFLAPLKDEYTLHVVDRVGHNPAYPVDSGWHSLSLELEAELAPIWYILGSFWEPAGRHFGFIFAIFMLLVF